MKSILIQLHATLEEIIAYLNAARTELGLSLTMMILKPFNLKEIDGDISQEDFEPYRGEIYIRFFLTKDKPNMVASSPNKFSDLNPSAIALNVGQLSERGIKESSLSFRSNDKDDIAIANKLAGKLKRITKSGVIAVDPISGSEANVRSHRYTLGAKIKYDEGIKILPIAGSCYLKLPD